MEFIYICVYISVEHIILCVCYICYQNSRNPGELLSAENELARLTQSTYPPAQLLQRPLPDGVDPTRLELYLSQQHFQVSVIYS